MFRSQDYVDFVKVNSLDGVFIANKFLMPKPKKKSELSAEDFEDATREKMRQN